MHIPDLPEAELDFRPIRAQGPGGQNVNKVETKAVVRLDVLRSPALPDWARPKLLERLAPRLTREGVLIVASERHRERERNLAAACARLVELLREALVERAPRKATKPTRGSQQRRVAAKKKRGGAKRSRGRPEVEDDDFDA